MGVTATAWSDHHVRISFRGGAVEHRRGRVARLQQIEVVIRGSRPRRASAQASHPRKRRDGDRASGVARHTVVTCENLSREENSLLTVCFDCTLGSALLVLLFRVDPSLRPPRGGARRSCVRVWGPGCAVSRSETLRPNIARAEWTRLCAPLSSSNDHTRARFCTRAAFAQETQQVCS